MPAKPLNQKPDRLPKLHSPPSTRYSKLLALAASCLESRDGRRGARVAAERLETLQETFEAIFATRSRVHRADPGSLWSCPEMQRRNLGDAGRGFSYF